ncbi:hypothetical protein LCGC14_0659450 [marine sediment metagenome]|uniref:Major facilitator superfamily (MFS) profile domain-containing protein n=1 Tax=marine sediment metagenome TaxID=412755 RepID=A0A0F9QZ66_9ZZZZ|nr:MFS transporter [bacterium]
MLSFSLVPLCGSFLIFIYFKEILALYGIFVFLSFLSKALIRTGMTGLYLKFVEGANNPTKSINRKMQIIFIVNSSSAFGFLLISLFFNLLVRNIVSLASWNSFFILGWSFSIPLIIFAFFYVKKVNFLKGRKEKEENKVKRHFNLSISQIFIMVVIYIAIFLSFSESLSFYPRSSWIFNKFTENSFRVYSSLYFIFSFCSLFGYYLSYILGKKASEKKVLILFSFICLYTPGMFLLTVSNFTTFMVLESLLTVLASILNLTYVSYVTDFSIKSKYQTFTYLLLQTPSSIASLIFVPLGTHLSVNISYENLVIISCFLFIASGVLLLIVLFFKEKEKSILLVPQERHIA